MSHSNAYSCQCQKSHLMRHDVSFWRKIQRLLVQNIIVAHAPLRTILGIKSAVGNRHVKGEQPAKPQEPARLLFKIAASMLMVFTSAVLLSNTEHHAGNLGDITCAYCDALLFPAESVHIPKNTQNKRHGKSCCKLGQIQLPPIKQHPGITTRIHDQSSALAKTFRKYPRKLNNALAMASAQTCILGGQHSWFPTFTIQGALHHRIGTMQPNAGAVERNFLQACKPHN